MGKYKVYDAETENHISRKRKANPFDTRNWVMYRGWKNQGDKKNSYTYHPVQGDGKWLKIENDVTLLVGFNIKFDLLYEWASPELKNFFKRGGKIWDCQYAEYLIEAQHPDSQMCSLDSIVEKYGGKKKIDEVKILWEAGYLTSQIDKQLMLDYLIGTKDEAYLGGDIGNTEKIFLGQLEKAKALGMIPMIMARMDGLCATTEMEYNGLKIDIAEAKRRTLELNQKLEKATEELEQYIPEMPEGLTFNWGSNVHKSCLIFGGTIGYKKSAPYIDDKTGELARKKAFEEVPDGMYVSGSKKGTQKFKRVEILGEIKTKIQKFFFDLPGYTIPKKEWVGKMTDGAGNSLYSTGADVIEALGNKDIPFLKLMALRQKLDKDLSTYYLSYDEKKKEYVGMLTCVDPVTHIVHHSLNHVNTITTRLSSSNPNMQNIPTDAEDESSGYTSQAKKLFISRYSTGVIMEIDYSQLEVVVQGMLSGDIQLCKDLKDKVDFHCKRVSAKFNCTYEEALFRCKDESYAQYHEWKNYRRECKEFSFQRAYGAGAAAIADKTGMEVDDVKTLIELEERMYPGIKRYNERVELEVKKSSVPFKQFFPEGGYKVYRRGFYVAPTGTRYSFKSHDALDWQKEKGIQDSFMPTELKNYPVQGTGGEIVQIMIGKLWRHFVSNDNYGGNALLCNTVHDSAWIDVNDVAIKDVAKDASRILSDVPNTLRELYGMEVNVPFPVDVEIGKNLYEKKHYG